MTTEAGAVMSATDERPSGDVGPLLEIDGLVKNFSIRGGLLRRQVANV